MSHASELALLFAETDEEVTAWLPPMIGPWLVTLEVSNASSCAQLLDFGICSVGTRQDSARVGVAVPLSIDAHKPVQLWVFLNEGLRRRHRFAS
jgi:hypothetical protein